MEESLTNKPADNAAVDIVEQKKENTRDTLVLIFIGWLLLYALIWILIPRLLHGFDSTAFKVVRIFVGLIHSAFPLVLAFAVRHRATKVWVFILAGIFMFFSLISTVYYAFFEYFNQLLGHF